MLPNRKNEVKVRASFDGDVEVLVGRGERVVTGLGLVIVEGEGELERMSARNAGVITEVLVRTGDTVQKGAVLVVIQEDLPSA
jgi:biotin carboxyl carrier protein